MMKKELKLGTTLFEIGQNKEKLSASNKYWFENFCQKSDQVDKICTDAAERLGEIDWELWRTGTDDHYLPGTRFSDALRVEKRCLEDILRHFHGFIDIGFLIANDTGRENIERNKTRNDRECNSFPRGNVDFGTSME